MILSEKGLKLDKAGFEKELKKQKDRSRAASEMNTDDWTVLVGDADENFVGYDTLESQVKITRYRKVSSKKGGDMFQLVFNVTPFYPEGGGQVGDKGYLEDAHGDVIYILDTKKENNVIIHFAKNLPKHINESFTAVVNESVRFRTACNHSATHLLHQALREVLGTHVQQKGSAVHDKYLRFDFSHFSKVSPEELQEVENFVNARIAEKLPLQEHRNIPKEEAIAEGAMSLFGEKYGDNVRTIRFGQSIELCGGTHVSNTGDIWHFKILSEGAVAAGIRRIEAITNTAAKEFFLENSQAFAEVKALLNNAKDPVKAVRSLQDENADLKKEIENLLKEKAGNIKDSLKQEIKVINGVQFLAIKLDLDAGGLKDVAFELGSQYENAFLLLASEQGKKALLSCYISKPLVEERDLNAGQVVRDLGKYIQGGGGGQAFFATAGGKNPAGIPEALEKALTYIQ